MALGHAYSSSSNTRLNKCEPLIKEFAQRLLIVSPTDLSVLRATIRNKAQQAEFVRLGVSDTMDSRHLPNERGLSEAVDFAIYIPGVNVWKHPSVMHMYEDLHDAAQSVARDMDVNIRSGVCWANLNQRRSFDDLLFDYRQRKRKQRRRPFFDGSHFELMDGYRT